MTLSAVAVAVAGRGTATPDRLLGRTAAFIAIYLTGRARCECPVTLDSASDKCR